MNRALHLCLVIILWSCSIASVPAIAQTPRQPDRNEKTTPDTRPEQPAYEPQLLKLAEIMGAISYLRGLCGDADADLWRQRMNALIEAEERTQSDREKLIGAYNSGTRAYVLTHQYCREGSQEAARRLAIEGEQMIRQLASRYGQ